MEATTEQSRETRVRRTCLDLMFAQTRTAWLSNAFCMVLIWIAFWNNANHSWLLGWTGLGVVMMALRDIQSRRYARLANQPINQAAWRRSQSERIDNAPLALSCALGWAKRLALGNTVSCSRATYRSLAQLIAKR